VECRSHVNEDSRRASARVVGVLARVAPLRTAAVACALALGRIAEAARMDLQGLFNVAQLSYVSARAVRRRHLN
jgi:hypothetical protein